MPKHAKKVSGYRGSINSLARKVARLHHKNRLEFFLALLHAIRREAFGDYGVVL